MKSGGGKGKGAGKGKSRKGKTKAEVAEMEVAMEAEQDAGGDKAGAQSLLLSGYNKAAAIVEQSHPEKYRYNIQFCAMSELYKFNEDVASWNGWAHGARSAK